MPDKYKLLEEFQDIIDIHFNDLDILKEALTHSSFTKHKRGSKVYNERLEFFGDSVLKLIISEYLYLNYKQYPEGHLSK